MIGFYDYTVVLTICSILSSVVGMTRAMEGHFRMAVILLALAGLFDAFDGKVARSKKNRTDDERLYGIQLDSIADIVSFGVFPAMIAYLMGMRELIDIVILCLYVVSGVIRLSFFNVLETKRFYNPTDEESVFHGLPITSISVFLPVSVLISFTMSEQQFIMLLRCIMLIIGILFVIDFKMRKPKNWQLALMIFIVGIAAAITLLFSHYKLPSKTEPEEPLVDIEEISDFDIITETE